MKKTLLLTLLLTFPFFWSFSDTKKELDRLFDTGLNNTALPPDSTIAIGNKLLIISQTLGYTQGILRGRVIKGIGYLFSNQLDSSSQQLLAAIQLAEHTNAKKSFEFGLAKNFLGSVFTRLNNLERAKQCFSEARNLFESMENRSYLCLATTNLGTIFGMQGSYPEALELFLTSQHLAKDPAVPVRRQAEALTNTATTLNLMGKKDEALKYAFNVLDIDQKNQHMRGVYMARNLIGNIYHRNQVLDSALFYYRLNLRSIPPDNPVFDPIVQRATISICQINIEKNNFLEAIGLLRKIERERKGFQLEILYNIIADTYLQKQQYDSTLFYAQKAFNMARRNKAKKKVMQASSYMQQAYFQQKTFDSAYHYQKLAHSYYDSIYNESNERKFNHAMIELATLEKQQEIDILRHEREIDTLRERITTASLASGILCVLIVFGFYRNRQRLKQRSLQKKLAQHHKQLTNHTLNMVHKNNGFMQMEEEVKSMSKKGEVNFQKLLNIINLNRSAERDWDNFNNYFSAAHPDFEEKFISKFPNLSIGDKRLASLIKMKLTNNEIASILNIESKSVRMNKYRLKRKLGLTEETDLLDYVSKI